MTVELSPRLPVLEMIDLAKIDVGPRLRALKAHRVEVLAQDIDFQGLLQPILVIATEGGFRLVDGAHRLAAFIKLERHTIDAKVLPADTPEATLAYAEIMANLDREDLTKLERAEHLAALKSAWEELNPSARHGGDRRSAAVRAVKEAQAGDDQGAIFALCSDVAEKVGLSRRLFYIAIDISKGLAPASKALIRGTWIEDHQATLMALAKEDEATQKAVLDLLLAEPAQAGTVAEALLLASGKPLPRPQDKIYMSTVSNWSRMNKSSREAFVETYREEIVSIAQRKGWI